MESITIKVEEALSKEISKFMSPNYSTKTEFIREAIRDKIKEIKKEKALDELKKYFGKAKIRTNHKEEREIREEIGKKFANKLGIDLN